MNIVDSITQGLVQAQNDAVNQYRAQRYDQINQLPPDQADAALAQVRSEIQVMQQHDNDVLQHLVDVVSSALAAPVVAGPQAPIESAAAPAKPPYLLLGGAALLLLLLRR